MRHFYWERHPDGPFVTLIAVATTYLHPEANEPEALRRRARREDDEEMRVFKAELREALLHPKRLPEGELSRNVQWVFGGPAEVFLRLLWWYLYRAEPPAPPQRQDAARAGKGDLVRTKYVTSSLFEGEFLPVGTEGTVLEVLPKNRRLVQLISIPQTDNDEYSYRGNPPDGDFPLVVLDEDEYEFIQGQDRK